MKKHISTIILLALASHCAAQVPSNATFQIPYKKADAQVRFNWGDKGIKTPIEWGFDLAWLSEDNVRRGIAFSGKDIVDIMRLSFQPTHSVENGFSEEQKKAMDKRISIVKTYCKDGVTYNMNCDHASLDEWYNDGCKTSTERAAHWAQLIDMTADYYKSKGLKNLVSISPLNEPDYEWHALPTFKHRMADFKAICQLMKTDETYKEKYADVRFCGGNTLNDDKAYEWWNYLKSYLDEGNTHQLAGDFDHYASFYETLVKAGHQATNDELHNTMEAMVGAEYGMQRGIWWGTAEHSRAQFMKATYQGKPGDRLGYAEHRQNWTAASVYRHADGNIQAFLGCSERQAKTTTYEFISQDRDVYFNGQGPMRHFAMELRAGTGYQTEDQRNAETVFDIQSGDDVQPYINGKYRIVNKYANRSASKGRYLGFSTNPGTNWVQLQQNTRPKSETNRGYTEWFVVPVDTRIGGDYSYYDIHMVGNEKIRMDILNWSLDAGGQVGAFPGGMGNNSIWYLQYAGDGWFYIRSKHSNLALSCSSTSVGQGNTTQATFKEGDEKQMWRFIDIDAEYDRVAPEAPANLQVTPQPVSIMLSWDAVDAEDLDGYDVLRTEKDTADWNMIARGLKTTQFIDNTAEDGKQYIYAVRSTDKALNYSEKSAEVEAAVTGEKALICQLSFENSLNDNSVNGNHAVMPSETVYETRSTYVKEGEAILSLNDGKSFVQLPSTIGNHNNLTISCWVRRSSTATWERIFDFGNGTDQYIFLTPSNGTKMRLEMKNGNTTEGVNVPILSGTKHLAVTLDGDNGVACVYVNGELKGTLEGMTIKPSDIKGVCNYIGRSQFSNDPFFKGYIDDFRVYNYALTAEEVANSMSPDTDALEQLKDNTISETKTYDLNGRPATQGHGIKVSKNNKVIVK